MDDYKGSDIYCDLVLTKSIEYDIVKETDNVLAYYHTEPSYAVHIVVLPKKHIASILELDMSSSLAVDILSTVQEVASSVERSNGSCRVITNVGSNQDSKHLHMHVVSGERVN